MTSDPGRARRSSLYYGWPVLFVAAAAMVGTLPGRTQGLGLITEPLIGDLQIDRISYANLNFWCTIAGAAGAIGIGRLIDRYGSRLVLTSVALALGVAVVAMSYATSWSALAITVTLTRALGQSALSVVSLAIVGHWFIRRIDSAMAIYTVAMSVGFMAAFPLVGWAVQAWGWRAAWFAVGAAEIAILAPVAWLVVRRSPESCGVEPDGAAIADTAPRENVSAADLDGVTWQYALTTPVFWLFAIGAALYGLVASGIGLFNESILAERGFGPAVYYQSLVITAMTALAGNFLGGWLASRVALGRLLALALGVLAVGLLALPHVASVMHVIGWATAMGLGGGLVIVLFFSVWPRVFGRRHLGRIQGAAQALTVLASALGPVLLAHCVAWTGSYAVMFRVLAAIIGGVAAATLLLPSRSLPPPALATAAGDLRASR